MNEFLVAGCLQDQGDGEIQPSSPALAAGKVSGRGGRLFTGQHLQVGAFSDWYPGAFASD